MVSVRGAFGKWLSHEGEALRNRISAFIKETPQSSLAPPAMWGHKEKYATQKTMLAPWNHTSSLELWEIIFCHSQATEPVVFCYKQSKHTKTGFSPLKKSSLGTQRSTLSLPKVNAWSFSPFPFQGKGTSQSFAHDSSFFRRKCFHKTKHRKRLTESGKWMILWAGYYHNS